eukprot:1966018-Pyramimonas_sp.AAC.2
MAGTVPPVVLMRENVCAVEPSDDALVGSDPALRESPREPKTVERPPGAQARFQVSLRTHATWQTCARRPKQSPHGT